MLEETSRFCAAVKEGVAEVDRGELLDDDEVRRWLEQQELSDLQAFSRYIEERQVRH